MVDADYNKYMINLQHDYRTHGVFAGGSADKEAMALIGLTLAACCADGICMGLGHIWSTYLFADGAAKERSETAILYQTNRLHSKARLLEMLMARGMIKTDAMNIVDTLEGYPDMFVAATLGDSNGAGPLGIAGDSMSEMSVSQNSTHSNTRRQSSNGRMNSFVRFHSYGENEYGDDKNDTLLVLTESLCEGLVMSIVFAAFSVIPAVVHIYIPRMVNDMYPPGTQYGQESIHPITGEFA